MVKIDQSGNERLPASRETTKAGCGQAKLSESSYRVAQPDQTFPVQLGDFALRVASADLTQGIEFVWSQSWRVIIHDAASSVQTLKLTSVFGPNVWVIGTSEASRPCAIRTRPIRGMLLRGSNICQRPPI
jgi:hypothetical protein